MSFLLKFCYALFVQTLVCVPLWQPSVARHEAVTEAYYGGQWNEIPVYQRDQITIARGRGDEAGQISPSQSSFTIDSRTTNFDPQDPLSPVFRKIGRGTPVRHAIRHRESGSGFLADARDAFERTVASGWGTADVGGAWSLFGSGGSVTVGDIDVTSGTGRMDIGGAPWYRATYLPQLRVADVDQVVTVVAPVATGGDLEVGLMARGTSIDDYVHGRAHLGTTGTVTLRVYSATDVLLGTAVSPTTHTGAAIKMRMRVVARDVFMKVWTASNAEPALWDLHAVDTSAVPVSGWVGIRTGRGTGNTNVATPTATYDDYAVTVDEPRFYGEVASWKPRRTVEFDESNPNVGDRWTEVVASDILRRLTGDPMQSAARRGVLRAGPIAYWPMEEKEGATLAQSAIPGMPDLVGRTGSAYINPTTGKRLPPPGLPKFGATDGPGGSDKIASFAEGGTLQARLPLVSAEQSWEIQFAVRFTPGVFDGATIFSNTLQWETGESPIHWGITFSDGSISVSADVAPFFYTTSTDLDDGAAHNISVFAYQNGGNVDSAIAVDNVLLAAGSFAGTISQPRNILINTAEAVDSKLPIGFGHLAVYAPFLDLTTTEETVSAYHGHTGEPAGSRIERLCAEEGIGFAGIGDLAGTMPMGPQRMVNFTDQLAECERTDGGVLGTPPGWLGLTYRARTSLYNQEPVLSLSATGQQLSDPLEPDIDDLDIGNDVTVTAPSGSIGTAVETAGAMSVSAPPDGIGRKKKAIDANPAFEYYLNHIAGWHLRHGTIEVARYPSLTLDLDSAPTLRGSASAAHPGSVLAVGGLRPDTVHVLIGKYVEKLGNYRRTIQFTGSPAEAYQVGVVEDEEYGYVGSDDTTVDTSFVAGTDSELIVDVATTLWAGGGAVDLECGGSRLLLDAVGSVLNANAWFRSGTTGWSSSNCTLTHSTAQQRRVEWGSGLVTPDGVSATGWIYATSQVNVLSSTSYVAQCWVYSPGGWSDLRPMVDWYTAGGAFISSSAGSGFAAPAGEWTFLSQTFTSPGTAGKAVMRAQHGGTPSSGAVWYVTAVALIPAGSLAASPQTLTVQTAPLNGVAKTIDVGTPVDLWTPWRAAL